MYQSNSRDGTTAEPPRTSTDMGPHRSRALSPPHGRASRSPREGPCSRSCIRVALSGHAGARGPLVALTRTPLTGVLLVRQSPAVRRDVNGHACPRAATAAWFGRGTEVAPVTHRAR